MRKILFRGKRIDTGKWVYGDLRQIENHCYIMDYDIGYDGISQISKIFDLHFEIDPETVGQFTGLCDKNGNRIFEGDICDCDDTVNHYRAKVVEDIANPDFILEYKNKFGYEDAEYDFVKCGNMSIKVVGNLYDNPELMR